MCGRYTLRQPELVEELPEAVPAPRYNIAPGQTPGTPPAYMIRRAGPTDSREAVAARWWLLPRWSKSSTVRFTTFNAAVEGLETKASFREPLRTQRCLVPVDGFYEWARGEVLRPHYIRRRDEDVFFFAGLWDHWSAPDTTRRDMSAYNV